MSNECYNNVLLDFHLVANLFLSWPKLLDVSLSAELSGGSSAQAEAGTLASTHGKMVKSQVIFSLRSVRDRAQCECR
jgi:hypothetical protein